VISLPTGAAVRCDYSVLAIDAEREVARICAALRDAVHRDLQRRGVVLGLSGGVDSSVCAGLAARALGPDKVLAVLLPERESSPRSAKLAMLVVEALGIAWERFDISAALDALGCYTRRDEAIRTLIPEYQPDWKWKVVISGGHSIGVNHFRVVAESPDGRRADLRLPYRQYKDIMAATNYKQRVRKNIEYFHAERLQYAVLGTANRLEHDQGFFVKNGDGAADVKPIAHLYKSQVYALAEYLGVPQAIRALPPSTDTFSMAQDQRELHFGLPYQEMDLALWAHDHGVPAATLATALAVTDETATLIYRDVEAKRRATRYNHAAPLYIEDVPIPMEHSP
jgi:NAD+ synthase